ncbi:MAG: beta-lactamase family protein [Actinobacteria bacterium]|nr:beta-lactamase family protein [Actinomycetota bacterium]
MRGIRTRRKEGPRRLRWTAPLAALVLGGLLLSGCTAGSDAGPAASSSAGAGGSADGAAITRPAAPAGALPAAMQAQLQAALEQVMAAHGVPGAAAGVWIPGKGSWTTAAGLADVEKKTPVSTDMSWPIRSITKSYTVTLLLQLADEGKVKLSDPLSAYVDGVTDGDRITLLQLANMSSGVADYVNQAFVTEFAKDPSKIYTLTELNKGVLGQPAQFAPGTEYVYTNANTNLIGAVIEKVTGKPYADVLKQRILDPIGQKNTHYITDVATWTGPHPIGYQPDPEGGAMLPQEENPSILGPAGSLFSTLDDGRVWAQALGSGSLLKPGTQALREIGHRIARPPYDLYAVGMGETDGWLGHNGEGVGFTAATFYNPVTGASIVVYMNESNVADGSHPADQAFRALAAVLSGATK